MSRSTYRYDEARLVGAEEDGTPVYGIGGHMVEDDINFYLFHYGYPISALGIGDEFFTMGWHCYHVIDGYGPDGYRLDRAITYRGVDKEEPDWWEVEGTR